MSDRAHTQPFDQFPGDRSTKKYVYSRDQLLSLFPGRGVRDGVCTAGSSGGEDVDNAAEWRVPIISRLQKDAPSEMTSHTPLLPVLLLNSSSSDADWQPDSCFRSAHTASTGHAQTDSSHSNNFGVFRGRSFRGGQRFTGDRPYIKDFPERRSSGTWNSQGDGGTGGGKFWHKSDTSSGNSSALDGASSLSTSKSSLSDCSQRIWHYKDPKNLVRGPFDTSEMNKWFRDGYFSHSLLVRSTNETSLYPLSVLVEKYGSNCPFSRQIESAATTATDRLTPSFLQSKVDEEKKKLEENKINFEEEKKQFYIERQKLTDKISLLEAEYFKKNESLEMKIELLKNDRLKHEQMVSDFNEDVTKHHEAVEEFDRKKANILEELKNENLKLKTDKVALDNEKKLLSQEKKEFEVFKNKENERLEAEHIKCKDYYTSLFERESEVKKAEARQANYRKEKHENNAKELPSISSVEKKCDKDDTELIKSLEKESRKNKKKSLVSSQQVQDLIASLEITPKEAGADTSKHKIATRPSNSSSEQADKPANKLTRFKWTNSSTDEASNLSFEAIQAEESRKQALSASVSSNNKKKDQELHTPECNSAWADSKSTVARLFSDTHKKPDDKSAAKKQPKSKNTHPVVTESHSRGFWNSDEDDEEAEEAPGTGDEQPTAAAQAREALIAWSQETLAPLDHTCGDRLDIRAFVQFLLDVDSRTEIANYISCNLGTSARVTRFAEEFVRRRAVWLALQESSDGQSSSSAGKCRPDKSSSTATGRRGRKKDQRLIAVDDIFSFTPAHAAPCEINIP